jgi:hypothetical protein
MAAVLFLSAMLLAGNILSDTDLAIAGLERVAWEDAETAPLGAIMLSSDGVDAVNDYLPLLGFVWLSSLVPFGLALFFAAGLAIVHYSRHPTVRGSYLTARALAVAATVVLLGVAAWPVVACTIYEWATVVPHRFDEPSVLSGGCDGIDVAMVPLALGCLLLVLAVFFGRSRWLGAVGGGLLGLVGGVLLWAQYGWR